MIRFPTKFLHRIRPLISRLLKAQQLKLTKNSSSNNASKIDFNDFLLPSLLPYGRYDTKTVTKSQTRVHVNYLCAFVEFFCGLKMIVIILVPWDQIEITLSGRAVHHKQFTSEVFLCVVFLHFYAGFNYLYFGRLCSNPSRLKCLNMFFLPDLNELCRRYNLESDSVERFVAKSQIYRKIMLMAIWCFEISFFLLILRCLIVSYLTIPFSYFLYLACPMGLITAFSFHLVGASFLRVFLLALLTIEFLILRAESVSRQMKLTYKTKGKCKPKFSKWILLKRRKSTIKGLATINDIVKQFTEANRLFDNLISPSSTATLLGGLIFPAFCLVNIPFYHKLAVMFLYTLALINNCFIISIWNDWFISKVS